MHVLVDEASFWCNASYMSDELARLLRTWQHKELSVWLTCQHFNRIPSEALSIYTEIAVFRCTAPRVLERLEREYGLDRNRVQGLARGEYVTLRGGF